MEIVGDSAFVASQVESVSFPSTLTSYSMGMAGALRPGVKLGYEVAANNPVFYAEDGVLYKKETDETTGQEKIILVAYPEAKGVEKFEVSGVDEIGRSAFYGVSDLKELSIIGTEERPISLGQDAFTYAADLEYLYMNDYVTSTTIGYMCESCTSLKKIVYPDGLIKGGYYVFAYCTSLEEFTVSKSMVTLDVGMFNQTYSLKKLIYDGKQTGGVSNAFGNGVYPRFDLVIGENVDTLRGANDLVGGFNVVIGRAETVTFVGPNQITAKVNSMAQAPGCLKDISGTI